MALAHLKNPPIALGFSSDGVDDYMKAGEGAFLYGQDEVMIVAWVYIPSEQPVETWRKTHLYGRWVPGIFWRCLSIGGDYSKTQTKFFINAFFVNEETGEVRDFAYNCYLLDQWVHVAWGYSKLVEKGLIYVNGDLVVERDITGWHADGFLGVLDDNLIDGFWIGSSTGGAENYKTITSETLIYSRILTAGEIGDLYSIRRNIMDGCVLKLGTVGLVRGGGTKWLDESPFKNHATVYGSKRVRCCHCNVVRDYGA